MTHSKRMPWNTGSRLSSCWLFSTRLVQTLPRFTNNFSDKNYLQNIFHFVILYSILLVLKMGFSKKKSMIWHWTVAIKQFKVIKHLQESCHRTLEPFKVKQSGLQVLNEITRQEIKILNNYLSLHCFIAFVEMKSGFCFRKKVVSCGLSSTEFFLHICLKKAVS